MLTETYLADILRHCNDGPSGDKKTALFFYILTTDDNFPVFSNFIASVFKLNPSGTYLALSMKGPTFIHRWLHGGWITIY